MQITREVRDYARSRGLSEKDAVGKGLKEKAEEFRSRGGQIYS
jgi:phosphomethylpyrimidine synthase